MYCKPITVKMKYLFLVQMKHPRYIPHPSLPLAGGRRTHLTKLLSVAYDIDAFGWRELKFVGGKFHIRLHAAEA